MKVFWRNDDLTESEAVLLNLCLEAHGVSALRQNISSMTVMNAASGSHDFGKTIIAALATLGGTHAPLDQSYNVLRVENIEPAISKGIMIPGWGNSFEKGHPDPNWERVDAHLKLMFPAIYGRIARITDLLHKSGKVIFPNPSIYTAAVGMALQMPPQILPWLFIAGRLNVWGLIFCKQLGLTKE